VTHLIVHPAEENRSTKDLVVSVPPPRAQDVAVFNARRLWKADDLVAHFSRRSAGYPQTTNITKIANYQFGADARYQYKYNKVVIRKEWVEEAIEAGTKFHGGDGYAGWEVKLVEIRGIYHNIISERSAWS
jgi:predicted RNA-binding protein